MIEYTLKDKERLVESCASVNETAGVLMPDVRTITISAAKLPETMRKDIMDTLSANNLFPLFLYRKPRDWFPRKIHMDHAHKGFKGKVLDMLHFYSTTRLGFAMLLFANKLIDR